MLDVKRIKELNLIIQNDRVEHRLSGRQNYGHLNLPGSYGAN